MWQEDQAHCDIWQSTFVLLLTIKGLNDIVVPQFQKTLTPQSERCCQKSAVSQHVGYFQRYCVDMYRFFEFYLHGPVRIIRAASWIRHCNSVNSSFGNKTGTVSACRLWTKQKMEQLLKQITETWGKHRHMSQKASFGARQDKSF